MIRSATHDEVPALVAAYEWLFAPPGSRPAMWDAERAAERLSALIAGDGEVFVADQDGAVVGICTVTLDIESVRFGPRAWVEDLAVDPAHPANRAIVDLDKAARENQGRVHFSADFCILQPADAARGSRRLLFEVTNRGRRNALRQFNRAPVASSATETPPGVGRARIDPSGANSWTHGSRFDTTTRLPPVPPISRS